MARYLLNFCSLDIMTLAGCVLKMDIFNFKNMENKHTKAPWQYAGGDNHSVEINIGETTCLVCRDDKNTGHYVIERSEMEANAILISAAPEMLDALQMIVEAFPKSVIENQLGEYYHKVYDSIQKATTI